MSSEEDRSTVAGNTQRKFHEDEFGRVVFETYMSGQTDGETDRQTDRHSLTWAKNKHQLLKSSRSSESSDVGIPSLSSVVHTVICKIDTFGSGTSSSEIRLKTYFATVL